MARVLSNSLYSIAWNGSLYVADTGNHRIRQVTPSGIITTVAGTGSYGYSGDGGPATSAQLQITQLFPILQLCAM